MVRPTVLKYSLYICSFTWQQKQNSGNHTLHKWETKFKTFRVSSALSLSLAIHYRYSVLFHSLSLIYASASSQHTPTQPSIAHWLPTPSPYVHLQKILTACQGDADRKGCDWSAQNLISGIYLCRILFHTMLSFLKRSCLRRHHVCRPHSSGCGLTAHHAPHPARPMSVSFTSSSSWTRTARGDFTSCVRSSWTQASRILWI